jgi:hypothetical protein
MESYDNAVQICYRKYNFPCCNESINQSRISQVSWFYNEWMNPGSVRVSWFYNENNECLDLGDANVYRFYNE